ncbi:MAG TPA: S8 family serine peptidase, partial [Xanthomonadales bacterium]|nr:S8 family serine peptidase [Xanthomonadales bacterium]
AEMAAAAAGGQLVSNHSYGIAAGWIYTGLLPPQQWWWIGGEFNTGEDPNFGYYDSETQLWDQIAFDAPYYLIVKAGGNDRTDIGPSPGEEYRVIDQDGNTIEFSTLPRDPDCWPTGYDCLPTNSVAKNILTVGAVDDLYGGYKQAEGPSSVAMADFSSWGPSDDGRIKPDLVGNGMFLYSTWPDSPYYAVAAGTSMAAPNISGSLLLLQQHYQNLHGTDQFMRSATLKALAIHTADEAGPAPGPDYAFGWGLLNSLKAADAISTDFTGGDQSIIEATLSNGATDSWPITLSTQGGTLTATLVWTDPPGTPPAPATDPANLMLVNDLDLRIVQGGSTWQPWILDPANPSAAATTGDNFRDNVEQVQVSGESAGSYTVQVNHKGGLLDGTAQAYSLVIGEEPPPPVSNGFLLDEDFSGGVLPPGWSIHTDQGVSWQVMAPQPGHSRFDNLTFGSGPFAIVYNNFSRTRTSLRTPVLDLSTHDTAVLRFNSAFPYADLLETLNVDISINGGSTWTQSVWQWFGFNPWPTHYDVDLSGIITGQANVMLAFRFDSHGDPQGDTWQVDDVQLEVFGAGPPPGEPPAPATNPQPTIGSSDISVEANLAWSSGAGVDTHEVYLGLAAPLNAADLVSSQVGSSYDPGTLSYGTTYYWRVDGVNENGTRTGATWSFATEVAPPPAGLIHVTGLEGVAVAEPRGRWSATADITVSSSSASPEAGVTVEGTWSNGATGSSSCQTAADGSCVMVKSNLKSNVSSVTFTITNLLKAGRQYDPA